MSSAAQINTRVAHLWFLTFAKNHGFVLILDHPTDECNVKDDGGSECHSKDSPSKMTREAF